MIATDTLAADLENRIDGAQEEMVLAAWRDFLEGRCPADVFVPPCRRPAPPAVEWPVIHVNDAQDDVELMVLHQLAGVSGALNGGNQILNVRCNYGIGILPSLFGCELFTMPRETDTLPNALPVGREGIPALIEAGRPAIRSALGGKVFACAERFREIFARHPKLGRWVSLYHPDLQGPIDVVEVVWGSEVFLAFCDEPDLVRAFLELVTDTYAAFMRDWLRLVAPAGCMADAGGRAAGADPAHPTYTAHWGLLIKGTLMVRNDSLMNLSPAIYREFVRPYDGRLFAEFGGGAIHFCGKGDHFIAELVQTPGLTGINLTQPELNDMGLVYRHTVDKGIALLGLDPRAVADARDKGRPLRGRVQAWQGATGDAGRGCHGG